MTDQFVNVDVKIERLQCSPEKCQPVAEVDEDSVGPITGNGDIDDRLIYSDASDNEEQLLAIARRKRALRSNFENADDTNPTGAEPLKKRSRAWGLTRPTQVAVVVTASVIKELLPNDCDVSQPNIADTSSSPALKVQVQGDGSDGDAGSSSELEDGEVSQSARDDSIAQAALELPACGPAVEPNSASSPRLPDLPDQLAAAGCPVKSAVRKTVARPCIYWCPAVDGAGDRRRNGRVGVKDRIKNYELAEDISPLPAPPPSDPYESVFDVAALEAAASFEQRQRDMRRLHPDSRQLPADFQSIGGRLVLDQTRLFRHRQTSSPQAVLHHFPRCLKPFEADELHRELLGYRPAAKLVNDDGDAESSSKFNWIGAKDRWPAALAKLRRRLSTMLKAPFVAAGLAFLDKPGDCTEWWHQSATSKDGSGLLPLLAALVLVGGPARPVEFRALRCQARSRHPRLHLSSARHGALLVAEGSAVSDWEVRLPAAVLELDCAAPSQELQTLIAVVLVCASRSIDSSDRS